MDYSMVAFFGLIIVIFGMTVLDEYLTKKKKD